MIIAELAQRAGLPAGVLNVVHGTVPTVNAICDHKDIKAISFVGGDKAGTHIYERGTKNGKRVQVWPSCFGKWKGLIAEAVWTERRILERRIMQSSCLMVWSLP